MHLIFCTLLLLIAAVIGQDISFITPGPSTTIDFSKNVIHPLGSQFHIEWTAGTDISKRISLVLFQSNGSALVYPFEYIARKCSTNSIKSCFLGFVCGYSGVSY